MKHLQSYVALLVALALIGCGGSSDRSNNGGQTPGLTAPRIEAIVRVERASLMHPDQFTDAQLLDPFNQDVYNDLQPSAKTVFGIQDPKNFQTNENYVFQLVQYRSDGTRIVLPSSWTTSDTEGIYGTIASNSGSFIASNQATASDQTVRAVYNGQEYQTQYAIRERQARVIGKIDFPADWSLYQTADYRVMIYFYNNTGLVVGQTTVSSDGTFRASIPAGAVAFTVVANSIPQSAYRVYSYEGNIYTASDPGCKAPLPALTIGSQVLSHITLIAKVPGQPSPDPTGCTG